MDQVIIRIKNVDGDFYNKDIKDATEEERYEWYTELSAGQIASVLELYVKNEKIRSDLL